MSNKPANPIKTDKKPEKNTETTTLLSPDELRAIAGGAGSPPTTPPGADWDKRAAAEWDHMSQPADQSPTNGGW